MTLARIMIAVAWCGMVFGCAAAGPPPAPIERSREVAGAPDAVRRQIEAKLAALGFSRPQDIGESVRTSSASPAWAECEAVLIGGGSDSGQKDFAMPQSRSASVTVRSALTAAGTRVEISTSFEATYYHRYRGTPFTAPCETTGELEQALLTAAG